MDSRFPHGRDGHLSTHVLDQDSIETGFGVHARVVAFCPDHEGLYCRVDRPAWSKRRDPMYPDLRDPTVPEILTAARKRNGRNEMRGAWLLRSKIEWEDGMHVDYYFDRQR